MSINSIARLAAALVLTSLANCSRYESKATPVSSDTPPSMMPQSPNSLPLGSAVNAPLTSRTGVVGSTSVGPAMTGTGIGR